MFSVAMEPLLIPPMSRRCVSFHIESMLPTFSHHFPYSLVQRKLKPESAIPGTVTSSCTCSLLSSSTLYNVVEYLMLVDEGFLNAFLPVDCIPSTSDHLFWDRILESFECLKAYSH